MVSRVGLLPLPFTGGFYKTRSKPLSNQQCINWQPNILESGAISDANLYHTPGLVQRTTAGAGSNRGSITLNGNPYYVCGTGFYRLNRLVNPDSSSTYSTVLLGTILGNSDVRMAANNRYIVIVVPGVKSYYFDETTGIVLEITDVDFAGPADDVVFLDAVFVFIKHGTNIVFHSALNNPASYDALDSYPVPQLTLAVGLMVYRNQLYVMGPNTTVPFSNVGALHFLFLPIPNSVIDTGLAAINAKTLFKESFVWLGSGQNAETAVWLYAGGSPQQISTEPINYLIQNATDEQLNKAFMMRHSQNGVEQVILTIGEVCLVYDLRASQLGGYQVWHERRSRIPLDGDINDAPWRVKSIIQAYNRIFVGDIIDGRIGEIADTVGTEYDNKMLCVLVTQPFSNMGVRGKVWAIEIYTDVGVSEEDVFSLEWSDDGGFTWSNPILRGTGEIGEYGRRIVYTRLGSFSRERILRIKYSGQYPRPINKIMANAQ